MISSQSNSMLMRHLAACHRQVVQLVMRTAGQEADKAESADVTRPPGIGRRDRQTARRPASASVLALQPLAIDRLRPARDHPLDRGERAAAAGDGDFEAAVNRRRRRLRP